MTANLGEKIQDPSVFIKPMEGAVWHTGEWALDLYQAELDTSCGY